MDSLRPSLPPSTAPVAAPAPDLRQPASPQPAADAVGASVPAAPAVDLKKAAAILAKPAATATVVPLWAGREATSGAPVRGADGKVHAVLPFEKCVAAFDPATGEQKWSLALGEAAVGPLVPSADGTRLLVAGESGTLHVIEQATGAEQCTLPLNGLPVAGRDGATYVANGEGLLKLDLATQTVTQRTPLANGLARVPQVGPDGTVFQVDANGRLRAHDPETGRELWNRSTGASAAATPAIGPDGTVYTPVGGTALAALDPKTGEEKWLYPTGHFILTAPVVGPDGLVILSSSDGLEALRPDTGRVRWRFDPRADIRIPPVVGSDGTLYVVAGRKAIHALDAVTGKRQWAFTPDWFPTHPPLGDARGELVFAGDNQRLRAYRDTDKARSRELAQAVYDADAAPPAEPPRVEIGEEWIVVGGIRVPVRADREA